QVLAGELTHAHDPVHEQRFGGRVEAQQPGVIAVAGRADVDPPILADLDGRVPRSLRGRALRSEDDVKGQPGRRLHGRRRRCGRGQWWRYRWFGLLRLETVADQPADAVAFAGVEQALAVPGEGTEADHARLPVHARDAAGHHFRRRT